MQDLYTINPKANILELKDAIHCSLHQAQAILTSVMFATEFIRPDMELDDKTLYYALWAVDSKLVDLERLVIQLEKVIQ